MTDHSKILEKIRKCMALSASSNENEAAAALRQARALMEKHGLTDADVLAAEAGEDGARASSASRPSNWEAALAGKTASIFGCHVIFRRGPFEKHASWVFIGTGANFEVARYCFEVLLRQVKRARSEHIKTHLQRCKTATKTRRADLYCEGWVQAAVGKLDAFALGEREQQAITAYMDIRFPALQEAKATDRNDGKTRLSERDYAAYAAGRVAGKAAQINRGVGASAAPLALE